jgi:serine/threonine protein kinase
MDIKPSNICFSPSMNELVFIDFGLSSVIEEKIGFKTGTRFAGSLNFCSPDMKECYNS